MPKYDIGMPILSDERMGFFIFGGTKMIKKIGLLMLFTLIAVFISKACLADIVYLKNGQEIEGLTKQTPEGVYVEGLLFTNDEIEHIEKKELKRKAYKGEPWYKGAMNFLGIKTSEQKRVEEVNNRLNKNSELIKEMDKTYEAERKKTKQDFSNVMSRAKQEQAKKKYEEVKRKNESEKASKEFKLKARKPIKLLNKTLVGKECTVGSPEGDKCRKIYEMR